MRVKPSGLLLAAAFLLLSRSWLLPASLFTAAACHELLYPQLGVKLCSMAGGGVQKSIWCF